MNAETMKEMVSDFLFDAGDDYADLELDGDPYFWDEIGRWVQECHDDDHSYYLVDYDGSIQIES